MLAMVSSSGGGSDYDSSDRRWVGVKDDILIEARATIDNGTGDEADSDQRRQHCRQ